MDETQSFRLIRTTDIVDITVSHVGGQNIIYWEDIKQVFPGVKYVQNGKVAITMLRDSDGARIMPHRIKHCPGVVLDVVLPTAGEHVHVDLLMTTPCLDPTDAATEDKVVEGLQITPTPAEAPVDDISVSTMLATPLLLPSSAFSSIAAATKTELSLKQIVNLASKKALESKIEQRLLLSLAPEVQAQVRGSLNMYNSFVQTIKDGQVEQADRMSKEFNKCYQDLKDEIAKNTNLTAQNAEQATRMVELLGALNAKQEEMNQLQIQVLGQLAVLQTRVQAVLTQTYELHEYPIPRLFIVLPQDPSLWDILKPFTHQFRLYFLCECGEHTKVETSNSKIPYHIHLAKHEGYGIARPSEFFNEYGPYVLTILKMLKFGITVTGVVVPAISQLISADVINEAITGLEQLKRHIEPGVDQVISYIEGIEGEAVEPMEDKEALEGADLRKLETFLQGKDGNKVLGNLYRTVTKEGHVKWVCIDHYRENYQAIAATAFRAMVGSVEGLFDENVGRVEVDLRSRVLAEQFYAALERAKSVHELKVKLSWETTYGDFKRLRDTLRRTSIGILEFDYTGTGPASDVMNRYRRYDPILQIMGHPSIQSFNMATIHSDFFSRSNLVTANADFSNLKHLVIGRVDSDDSIDKFKLVLSHAPNLSSLSLVTCKEFFERSNPWYIFPDLKYMNIGPLDSGGDIIELDMVRKRPSDSSLCLKVPIKFFEQCNLWSADAEFPNLKGLAINGFDLDTTIYKFKPILTHSLITLDLRDNSIRFTGAQALSEALKSNSTLTTLNLQQNSIGDNGAQALSEALKSNSTITTLDLQQNFIGDNGAQTLSETLKTNSTITTLDLQQNSIGDNGAQALSEALKTNSTITTLDLQQNSIRDNGAQALSEALKTNSTITTLNLQQNSIEDNGAQALFKALKTNSTIITLDLQQNSIGDNGAQALSVALKSNSALTNLDLRSNLIGFEGTLALALARKINSTLITLDLRFNKIGENAIQALFEAFKTNSTLITLDLHQNSIRDNGVQALSEALKTNSTITTLNLQQNSIGDNGAQALSKALKTNSTIITLDLQRNSIGDNGAQALSEALKSNSTLTNLDLRSNLIGFEGTLALDLARKINSTLITLDLHFNEIEEKVIQALFEAFKTNSTLITLDLHQNSIRDNGVQALSEALKTNSTITTLNLQQNFIGDNGAQALSEVLKTSLALVTLDLRNNRIEDSGAQALFGALKTNSTLTTLNLESNSIGGSGAQALSDALKTNSTLTTLNLGRNLIGDNGAQALSEALKINWTVTTLQLDYNSIGDGGVQ
ncbi:hypothetical protein BGX27_002596, partial [Mortierella sp. AM989]